MGAKPTVVSLFTGAGGLDIGLEQAGWSTVTATDVDPAAIGTLKANKAKALPVPGRPGKTYLEDAAILHADIRDLHAADLRPAGVRRTWRPALLAGGPPCQPWSSAGLQKGFHDPRGLLIGQMIRIADELKPRFVLMENVRGLLTASSPGGEHGEAIRMIQSEWENLGYAVRWGLLNAADFGAAQRRVRLLMFASSEHQVPEMPAPTHSRHPEQGRKPWVSLGEFLSYQPAPEESDVVRPSGARAEQLLALEPGTGIKTGGTVEHQRPGGHWGYRQDSFVADPNLPSRTIRAAATPDWLKFGPGDMRRLTWRECAGLQGFPTQWEFDGPRDARVRLIGNAVQADMAEALGEVLIGALASRVRVESPTSPEWPEYFHRRIKGARADHRANAAARKRRSTPRAS